MQLGLLGMLLGLPQGALPDGQAQGKAQGGVADLFAQLLGDSGQQEAGQQSTAGGGQLLADIAPSTLVAQEVDAGHATAKSELDALQALLNQEISAEDATDLLAQWDALSADLTQGQAGDEGAHSLLTQLKQELTQIRDSKEPKTVAAVLTQLSALQTAPTERAPVVERMLAWMKNTFAARQPEPAQETVVADVADSSTPSALLQSLQAASFRDAPAAEASAGKEEGKERETLEIIPLAMTAHVAAPAWVQRLTEMPATPTTQAADIAAAPIDVADLPPETGFDIPGLEVPVNAAPTTDSDALPEISLPQLRTDAGPSAGKAFRDALEAAPGSATDASHAAAHSAATDEVAQVAGVQQPSAHAAANDHRATPVHVTSHLATNHAPVAEQVHVAVQRATKEGIDQLTIQLEPADLGRVEVKMTTGADGQTQLSFMVDKAETMDALARDARTLERALQDAGVKADAGNMQFNLRQQAHADTGQQGQQQGGRNAYGEAEDDEAAIAPQAAAAAARNYTLTLRDGVDIRA